MARPPTAWAIGDAATVRGFELAGFRGVVAESSEAVRAALRRAGDEGAELAVVTEQAVSLAPDVLEVDRGSVRPVVVEVPSVAGPRAAPDAGERLRRAVRRALGIPSAVSSGARP